MEQAVCWNLKGLKAYATGSFASKLGIVLISDVFGYEAPKLRKLADKVAAAGFYVVVPDFFYGDSFSYDNAEKPLPVWIKLHGWEKEFEDAKTVIAALKSQGISAVGAAGFCCGEAQVPIAILGAEVDMFSPLELLKQFEEILSSKSEVNSFLKIFPGTVHGWTVRYSDEDEDAVKSAEEANQDMFA